MSASSVSASTTRPSSSLVATVHIMTEIGKRLIGAAREAAEIARGERKPAAQYIPADIDVRGIRKKLKLSQEDFVSQFGFTVNQIRDWEQQRARPLGGVRAHLMIIDRAPDQIRELIQQSEF